MNWSAIIGVGTGQGTGVRRLIGDTGTPTWSDADLLQFGYDGCLEILDRRGAGVTLDTKGNRTPVTLLTATTDAFPLADRWASAVSWYITWRVRNSGFVDSKAGNKHALDARAAFEKELSR